jgi:hypothetical protein
MACNSHPEFLGVLECTEVETRPQILTVETTEGKKMQWWRWSDRAIVLDMDAVHRTFHSRVPCLRCCHTWGEHQGMKCPMGLCGTFVPSMDELMELHPELRQDDEFFDSIGL